MLAERVNDTAYTENNAKRLEIFDRRFALFQAHRG